MQLIRPCFYSAVLLLILGSEDAPPGAEELHFGAARDMVLAGVEDLPDVPVVARDGGDADRSATVDLLVADLGDRDLVLPQRGDDRAHVGALGLQRAGVLGQEEVEFNTSSEHRSRLRVGPDNPKIFCSRGARFPALHVTASETSGFAKSATGT